MEVFGRSWRSIGPLMLVGVFLPSLVFGTSYNFSTRDAGGFDAYGWEVVGRGGPSLILGLVLGYLTAVAWAGALRVAAKEAVGQTSDFGESLRYGFTRGLSLWGWGILAYVTVVVGLVLCVLPGLWALVALSLVAPVTVFERANSYLRSIKLVHSGFAAALGRLLITWLVASVYGCVVGLLGGCVAAAFGAGADSTLGDGAAFAVIALVQAVVSLLLLAPAVWMVGAILCVYAGLRSAREEVTAESLAAAADA